MFRHTSMIIFGIVGASFLMFNCKDSKKELPVIKIEVKEAEVDTIPQVDTLAVSPDTIQEVKIVEKPKITKPKIKKRKKQSTVFPKVVYKDYVVDDETGNIAFFVEINGKKHLMRIRDVIGELELTAGDAKRISVVYKTQRKLIEIRQ